MEKILIIEDDRNVAELLNDFLKLCGFYCDIKEDGEEGLNKIYEGKAVYSAVLLDIMLPKKDGFFVLKEIRKAFDIPVLIVSARSDEADKIRAFSLGADDYIVKPPSLPELVSRLRRNIERTKPKDSLDDKKEKPFIKIRNLSIDVMGKTVRLNGKEIPLRKMEYDLLLYLSMNRGKVFTKEELFLTLWHEDGLGSINTVYQHIKELRAKIGTEFIKTIWGKGYTIS